MKKFTSIMLALLMVIAMSVTSFGVTDGYLDGGAIPETAGPLVTGENGNNTKDLPVGITYTYEEGEASAVKTYYVTLEYLFPAALEAIETEVAYVWDAENGKYVKETAAEEKQENPKEEEPTKGNPKEGEKPVEESAPADSNTYTLDNGGHFEIKLTNQSNVDVSYDVSYNKDEAAVFDSEAAFSKEENEGSTGKIATVASTDYQRVYEDSNDITITDSESAQTGKGDTPFNTASCKGTLAVTGINPGKTPEAEGSDTLGNFHIVINDATENAKITIADILPSDFPVTKAGTELEYPRWIDKDGGSATLVADGTLGKEYIFFNDLDEAQFGSKDITVPFDTEVIDNTAKYNGYTVTFATNGGKATSITFTRDENNASLTFVPPAGDGGEEDEEKDKEEDTDPNLIKITIASYFDGKGLPEADTSGIADKSSTLALWYNHEKGLHFSFAGTSIVGTCSPETEIKNNECLTTEGQSVAFTIDGGKLTAVVFAYNSEKYTFDVSSLDIEIVEEEATK